MLLFVALQLPEGRTGRVFERAAALFARSQPQLEEREALGVRYRLIRAPSRGNTPDWDAVARLAGTGALLLPEGIEPPPNCPVTPLSCPRFERRMLLATACEIIKRTRMPMFRRIAGLWDPEGRHGGMLAPLLHYYTAVHVVTDAAERYQRAAADIIERLGAPVTYSPDVSILADCVLILAPGTAPDLKDYSPPCPVLATDTVSLPAGSESFTRLVATVRPDIARHCPPGIAPHRFAAALHDCGGVDVGRYVAHRMLCNESPSDLPECVRSVMQRLGKLY